MTATSPWLIVPAAVVVALAAAYVLYVQLFRDKGQRAVQRGSRQPPRHGLAAEPARRTVVRAATAGQPPAEITSAPCQESPAAGTWQAPPPFLRSDAPTVVISPAIPVGQP